MPVDVTSTTSTSSSAAHTAPVAHEHAGRDKHTDKHVGEDRMAPKVDDATAEAVGKLSEALEWVERARGALFEFHQLSGHADQTLGEAIDALAAAGHPRAAAHLRRELHGRNVLDGRWTFQIVEEYDDLYYRPFVDADERIRMRFTGGRRHVYEARMKAAEREEAGRDPWGPGA
jgi:hypothetical protein